MKKTVHLALLAICLVMLMCIGASASEAICEFIPSWANQCFTNGSDCVFDYSEDGVTVISKNGPGSSENAKGDVYAHVTLDTPFDGDKYQWIKIRIRNRSDAEVFEFHFASTATDDSVTADTCTHFPVSAKDSEYKEYIFNIPEYNMASQNVNEEVTLEKSVWSGDISIVRFDFMWLAEPSGQVPTGSEMDVQYIGFFDSKEAAEAHEFVADSASSDKTEGWDETYTWIFNNNITAGSFAESGMESYLEHGALRIIPTNGDPMMTFEFDESEQLDTAEYRYMGILIKTESTVAAGAVFVATDKNPEFSGSGGYASYALTNNGEYQKVIIDLKNSIDFWAQGGKLKKFRLDPINGNDLEATVYLARVGIFKDITQAKNFVATDVDEYGESTFYGETHRVVVPSGVLSEGYDKTQYMLKNDAVLKSEDGSRPVVYYTDGAGNSSVVALCYTNPAGYTTYVARKSGTYTVAFNKKEYVDITGHWGESYIDFVSERALFGGTSPTEFSPEETMTRGMFVTVLGRMHGVDVSNYDGNTGYSDVDSGEYYAPYIQWAKEIGIFAPVSDTEFAPESPITREVMAVVIANYVDAYSYNFPSNATNVEFTDISALSAQSIAAINAAQAAGIINGKGDGIFDPAGVSTRAEVATVMQRVIKGILGIKTYTSDYEEGYHTRDRIRVGIWNFNAGKFKTEEDFKIAYDMGVDYLVSTAGTGPDYTNERLLTFADKYGMEANIQIEGNVYNDPTKDDDVFTTVDDYNPLEMTANYYEHPSFGGTYIVDEPGMIDYERLAAICNEYTELLPGKRPFINLLPMYANDAQLQYGANAASIQYYDNTGDIYKRYCDQFCEMFNVDYICTDIYPLNWASGKKTTYSDYVESINQIATSAREHGKEFWCCVQTFDWTTSHSKRDPSEEEFRWQCYSMLSFGCTGILFWTYWSGNDNTPALVYNDKTPTHNYYAAQPVAWEMRRLSDTFIQYKNLGAFTHNCTSATPYLKMSGEYKDFDIISNIDCADPLLIGCFEKKDGAGHAFTLVNMVEFSEARGTTVKFTLAASDKTVTVYGKDDPKVITAVNGVYTVELEEGQGVFVTVE